MPSVKIRFTYNYFFRYLVFSFHFVIINEIYTKAYTPITAKQTKNTDGFLERKNNIMTLVKKEFSVILFALFFISYLLYAFFGVLPFKAKLFFIEMPSLRDIFFGLLLALPALPVTVYFLIKKNKKNKTENDCKETAVINKAIEMLQEGDKRFTSANKVPFKDVIDEFSKVTLADKNLWLNYDMPSTSKNIEFDYFEEITLLVKLLEEADSSHLKNCKKDNAGRLTEYDEVLKCRAAAMKIWDNYAIPWRLKNNNVHIIFSPNVITGKPVIGTYDVSSFLKIIAVILEHRAGNELEKSKKLFYKNLGISALIIFCFALTLLLIKC